MNSNKPLLNIANNQIQLTNFEHFFGSHKILQSSFLKKFSEGNLSKNQIKIWISQQFYFSIQFPRCLAALYSRIEDFNTSKLLMNFLNIEHWGSENNSAHWKMFVKVLNFFDLGLDELNKNSPFEETEIYLNYRLNLCLNADIEKGLGAMGFGHEFINEKIFKSYLKGMELIENIDDEALQYFKAHVDDEPEDYQLFKKMILMYCNSDVSIEKVKMGAEEVLEQRLLFYDRMLKRIEN